MRDSDDYAHDRTLHGVNQLRDHIVDYDTAVPEVPTEGGCLATLIVGGILCASGGIVLAAILGLIALGGWILRTFS